MKSKAARWLLGASLLAGSAVATAAVPPPINPGERPTVNSTEAELWYGMDQAERELKTAPVLVHDPALNRYVRDVACRVVGNDYCPDLRVYIIDAPVFNASMAPNGAMVVFTGALLRMQDEDELAVVLGHEFAHYWQRHSLRFWNKAKGTTAFLATFNLLTGYTLIGSVATLAGIASLSGYSRDMEREADRLGFQRITGLQYDPQAGVRVWGRMLREEKASKQRKPGPVFSTHPRTAERLEDVTTTAKALAAEPVAAKREAYRATMAPFLTRWLDAELSRRTYDTSIQVIGDLRTEATVDAQGLYTFYLAEAYRRRGKNDDKATAEKLYAEAVAHANPPAAAWREHGYLLRDKGQPAAAAESFKRYLAGAPEAPDRAFIETYLKTTETQP